MFKNVMVPVDLNHLEQLGKAIELAAMHTKHGGGSLHLVHVGAAEPGQYGKISADRLQQLENFSAEVATRFHVPVNPQALASDEQATDLDELLLIAVDLTKADLVVVASHVPTFGDFLTGSHGAHLAEHSQVSVFVVREGKPIG
ncbi:MAG: universal stress protein [Boseongicola sp.]|nr:MAG: universal stress protein [Boseongicola sp.]